MKGILKRDAEKRLWKGILSSKYNGERYGYSGTKTEGKRVEA